VQKFSYSTISEVREPAARLYGLLARRLEVSPFLEEAAAILQDCSHSVSAMMWGESRFSLFLLDKNNINP